MNAAIHVLMYLYYGLASCGPKIQKYLWWKKYLTIIQMVRYHFTMWPIIAAWRKSGGGCVCVCAWVSASVGS